eukprot:PITA_07517
MNDKFKATMMNEFEMKDLGIMKYFLGMEVYQSKDEIFICQTKYAHDMLNKFDMLDCHPSPTPSAHGEVLCRDDGADLVDEKTYRSIVGSLIFLTHTRPDITYSVSLVSRYMTNPSEIYMKAAKRILRYVKGTLNFGIHYYSSGKFNLVGFSDLDWGGSLDDRKSTSGNCFSFGSGLITWSSKKQSIVALSSTEAEYVAVTSTVSDTKENESMIISVLVFTDTEEEAAVAYDTAAIKHWAPHKLVATNFDVKNYDLDQIRRPELCHSKREINTCTATASEPKSACPYKFNAHIHEYNLRHHAAG